MNNSETKNLKYDLHIFLCDRALVCYQKLLDRY